jgi:hypothetical protein
MPVEKYVFRFSKISKTDSKAQTAAYCELFIRMRRPGHEPDHSTPSSTEFKNVCGAMPPLPHGVVMKHEDNFDIPLTDSVMLQNAW